MELLSQRGGDGGAKTICAFEHADDCRLWTVDGT